MPLALKPSLFGLFVFDPTIQSKTPGVHLAYLYSKPVFINSIKFGRRSQFRGGRFCGLVGLPLL